jgi:predicted kinase
VGPSGRRVVLVSGAPGSGKTSLAAPLAAELGCALLGKDRIKETLHDALGAPESDLAAASGRSGGHPSDVVVVRFR